MVYKLEKEAKNIVFKTYTGITHLILSNFSHVDCHGYAYGKKVPVGN